MCTLRAVAASTQICIRKTSLSSTVPRTVWVWGTPADKQAGCHTETARLDSASMTKTATEDLSWAQTVAAPLLKVCRCSQASCFLSQMLAKPQEGNTWVCYLGTSDLGPSIETLQNLVTHFGAQRDSLLDKLRIKLEQLKEVCLQESVSIQLSSQELPCCGGPTAFFAIWSTNENVFVSNVINFLPNKNVFVSNVTNFAYEIRKFL